MATNPRMKPCPKCLTTDHLGIYKYETGVQHVECDKCFYMGPGDGSQRKAIKAHNEHVASSAPTGAPNATEI